MNEFKYLKLKNMKLFIKSCLNDKELVVRFREDNVKVYYISQRIFEVSTQDKIKLWTKLKNVDYKEYKSKIEEKLKVDNNTKLKEENGIFSVITSNITNEDINYLIEELKNIIKKYRENEKIGKTENEFQYEFMLSLYNDNNKNHIKKYYEYIFEQEFVMYKEPNPTKSTKYGRSDCLVINTNKVIFVELKYGSKALGDKHGIESHIKDMKEILENNGNILSEIGNYIKIRYNAIRKLYFENSNNPNIPNHLFYKHLETIYKIELEKVEFHIICGHSNCEKDKVENKVKEIIEKNETKELIRNLNEHSNCDVKVFISDDNLTMEQI